MSHGLSAMDDSTRISGMKQVSAAASGEKPWPEFLASLQMLSAEELAQKVKQLDASASKAPQNFNLRMQLCYAVALQRDTAYTVAGGRYHYALGVHQALRGLYEGGRFYLDASS